MASSSLEMSGGIVEEGAGYARCVRVLTDLAIAAGVDPDAVVGGLGPQSPWEDVAAALDKLEALAGGAQAMEELGERTMARASRGSALAFLFGEPASLYEYVLAIKSRAAIPVLEGGVVRSADASRFELHLGLPPDRRGSATLWRLALGGARGLARHAGLPRAEVEAREITPHRLVAAVRVARARGIVPAVLRRTRAALARLRGELVHQKEVLVEANERLLRELEARALAEAALGALLEAVPGSAFVVDDRGAARPLNPAAEAALARQGAALRARLAAAAGGEAPSGMDVAVLSAPGQASAHLVLLRDGTQALARRLDGAAERWDLTPRETAVLARLAHGASNAAIAGELGCGADTVEAHVSQLLAKSGASGRTALVAALWSGQAPEALRAAEGGP